MDTLAANNQIINADIYNSMVLNRREQNTERLGMLAAFSIVLIFFAASFYFFNAGKDVAGGIFLGAIAGIIVYFVHKRQTPEQPPVLLKKKKN